MRRALIPMLRCPRCRAADFQLESAEHDEREVRRGQLACGACGQHYAVEGGILDLLYQPKESIVRELRGWEQLVGTGQQGADAELLLLPYHPDAMWQRIAADFDAVLARVDLRGQHVLDIGSGRTWSAHQVALRGAEVVATDILRVKGVGLETADLYLRGHDVFYERVLCDMEDLPFADQSFDYVLSTAALHHALDLEGVFCEVRRILRPSGGLLLTNEPVLRRGAAHSWEGNAEIAAGINEHIYAIDEWIAAMHTAGFTPTLILPESLRRAAHEGQLHTVVPPELNTEFLRRLFAASEGAWAERHDSLLRLYRCYSLPLTLVAQRADPAQAELLAPAAPDDIDLFLSLATGIPSMPAAPDNDEVAALRERLRACEDERAALRRLVAGYENGRVMRLLKWLQTRR
jgi:ubiquinone/menaquinone biosynthesis C-methylase UbiE/uncharacterized protein YbaR (Trm112 family)